MKNSCIPIGSSKMCLVLLPTNRETHRQSNLASTAGRAYQALYTFVTSLQLFSDYVVFLCDAHVMRVFSDVYEISSQTDTNKTLAQW